MRKIKNQPSCLEYFIKLRETFFKKDAVDFNFGKMNFYKLIKYAHIKKEHILKKSKDFSFEIQFYLIFIFNSFLDI